MREHQRQERFLHDSEGFPLTDKSGSIILNGSFIESSGFPGATGFIGLAVVPELMSAGHQVVGLARSEKGAETLAQAGAEVFRCDVNDLDRLRTATETVDAVIHAAFNHDFANPKQNSEDDRKVIETLGEGMAGSGRPLLVTSGTGLVRATTNAPASETDGHVTSAEFAHAATEEAAGALIADGERVIVLRLPQVHDTRKQGRITQHILLARQKGWVAYIGEGKNRVPAVHVSDARGSTGWRSKRAAQERATTPLVKRASLCAKLPRPSARD